MVVEEGLVVEEGWGSRLLKILYPTEQSWQVELLCSLALFLCQPLQINVLIFLLGFTAKLQ